MSGRYESVIVGGGIAGLACARRLHESQRSFLLITENVGGRICTSVDGTVNIGAYYVRDDYSHVNQFVDRGRRVTRRQVLSGDPSGSFTRSDVPLLLHPIQTVRFVRLMRDFRRRYDAFKQDCMLRSQAEAIRSDPLLRDLYHEPASEFIRRHQIEDIARTYLAPAVQATAFIPVDRLTAFTMLVGVLALTIPIYQYTPRLERLTAGFEDALLLDSVTAINSTASGYSIETSDSGVTTADNVVVATPTGVSASLLDLGRIKSPVDAHMFLVTGTLREPWNRARYSLFPDGSPVLGIAQQTGGSTLFYSVTHDPDFEHYFSTWNVTEHHHWNPAFHLEGDVLLECEQAPGLYLIGDHNVCTLEDSYITGVHAANRILTGHRKTTPT